VKSRDIYGADHDDFRVAVRSWLSSAVLPHTDDYAANKGFPRSLWHSAARQGLLGLEVPEAYGGTQAGDYRFNAVLLEELAAINVALASCLSIHFDVVSGYLVHLTSDEQRDRWLPGFCSGDLVSAIAMTEPGGGSDLAALRTQAVRDGDAWVLNGAKTFITNGGSADVVVVAARTSSSGAKGISLFLVEADREGFRRGRTLDKVGLPEADTAELFFDDVRVPGANLIGQLDRGFAHMMSHLPQERLGCAITNLANAAQLLGETVQYCRERTAFGSSIAAMQHNKFLLADLATSVDVAQAFVDQCITRHASGQLSATDAAKAKLCTSQVQNEVLDHCVQLHGGYGFMNEYRVARAWKDARVTKIWGGSNEIMREVIGRDLIG